MKPVPTRFASLGPWSARLILVLVGSLVVYGILQSPPPSSAGSELEAGVGDVYLYMAIVHRVRAGEHYYSAAGQELESRVYASRPFLNWRLPTTALLMAAFPSDMAAAWLLRGLSFLAILLISAKLYFSSLSLPKAILGIVFLTGAVGLALNDYAVFFHEVWAMVLITISLAVYHPRYWIGSVVMGSIALLFRELSLAFVGAMMFAAWIAGRRREVAGWAVGSAVFLILLAVHASVVSGLVSSDGPEKSWLALGGWPFVLRTAKWNLFFILSSGWITAVTVPLALLGAVAWKGHLGLQISLIIGCYLCAYMIFGNPENVYWGILYGPFLALGIPHCIAGLRDLWRVGTGRRQHV